MHVQTREPVQRGTGRNSSGVGGEPSQRRTAACAVHRLVRHHLFRRTHHNVGVPTPPCPHLPAPRQRRLYLFEYRQTPSSPDSTLLLFEYRQTPSSPDFTLIRVPTDTLLLSHINRTSLPQCHSSSSRRSGARHRSHIASCTSLSRRCSSQPVNGTTVRGTVVP